MEAAGTGITRAGTPVRIYDIHGGGDYCIIGAWLEEEEDRWIPQAWMDNGCIIDSKTPRSLDIVQIHTTMDTSEAA